MNAINERREQLEQFRPRLNTLIKTMSSNETDNSYGPVSHGVIRLLLLDLCDAQNKEPLFLADTCLACGDVFPMVRGFFILKRGMYLGCCSGHCASEMSYGA